MALPMLAQETLYVGVDVGKKVHVAGFISSTLLTRHQRFEHCPALAFDDSREGFRSLIDRIKIYVPPTQVQVLSWKSPDTTTALCSNICKSKTSLSM